MHEFAEAGAALPELMDDGAARRTGLSQPFGDHQLAHRLDAQAQPVALA